MLACKGSTEPDRQRVLAYQGLHIRRRFTRAEPDELVANLDCHSKIHLIDMLGTASSNNDMSRNDSAKIEQNQASPDFLFDVLDLF